MRVAIADDSALFRAGLSMLLESSGIVVTSQAPTGDELLTQVAHDPPDVAILDIRMPPTFTEEGLDTAYALGQRHPDVGVLVLSTYAETAYAERLFRDGAAGRGYMLKDRVDNLDALNDALKRLHSGEPVMDSMVVDRLMGRSRHRSTLDALSERERAVLQQMAEGRSNAGIGAALHLSPRTVETHVAGIFTRLGFAASTDDNRRVLAVLSWLRDIRPPPTARPW
jgi:DNA-binding NarL/FixJ family response regulator